jgi:hypothetical protein
MQMYKIYYVLITVICCACSFIASAKDIDPKFEDPAFWEDKITESYATGIINQIPDMIKQQNIKTRQIEQSTDDAHLAKLRKRFFTFVKNNKLNQAEAISKLMLKKGDYTGERYLQSLK